MSAQISLGKAWNWETPDYSLFSTNYPLPCSISFVSSTAFISSHRHQSKI